MDRPVAPATFYFDLGSPYAYLASHRLDDLIPTPLDLQPISLGALFTLTGRSSWALSDDPAGRASGMAEVERRAHAYGLPPIRWPDPWPGHYLYAMRAATFAAEVSRACDFMASAFRAAFVQGHDLSIPARVLDAARDAGLDPREVDSATRDPATKLALRDATGAAHRLGVFGVPTVLLDGADSGSDLGGRELFWGDDRLEDAAAALLRRRQDR